MYQFINVCVCVCARVFEERVKECLTLVRVNIKCSLYLPENTCR